MTESPVAETAFARKRIAIVEDHRLLVQSLSVALRAEGLEVTSADLSGEDKLLASIAPLDRLLVLLDLDLGEPLVDGVRLIPPLRAAGAIVVVVTGTEDVLRIAAAVEAGATGYLRKHEDFHILLRAVLDAAAGKVILDDCHRHELLAMVRRERAAERQRLAPFRTLTPKEQLVLREIGDGKSVEQIATEWVVSEATVRTQVRGVLTKLDVRSQLAAVARARAAGWRIGD